MPLGYTIVRLLLRVWFGVVYGKIRLLGAADEAASGAAVLVVGHPPRLFDVLLLVAGLDRQLHCLVDPAIVRGLALRFLVRSLGTIPDAPGGWEDAIHACRESLEREETIVVFTQGPGDIGDAQPRLTALARMALDVESRRSSPLEIAVLPVHVMMPFAPLSEALIHFGEAIFPRDLLSSGHSAPEERAAELRAALSQACEANPFALRREDVDHLLGDLTQVLRSALAAEWEARPDWKQTVEGFTLSRFVAAWVEQANRFDPHKLVALRETLDTYREAQRRYALRTFEIENAPWMRSMVRRALAWMESVLGLPVACYGLVSHLPAGLLALLSGLWGRLKKRTRPGEWAVGVALVVSSYAAMIAFVSHRFGRSAAGYYAVTLPLSGIYLWRYTWLWRHKTHLLLQQLLAPRHQTRLWRRRKQLLVQVEAARNAYADTLGLAH